MVTNPAQNVGSIFPADKTDPGKRLGLEKEGQHYQVVVIDRTPMEGSKFLLTVQWGGDRYKLWWIMWIPIRT